MKDLSLDKNEDAAGMEEESIHRVASILNAKNLQDNPSDFCLDCKVKIPEERREVLPNCRYCIKCQGEHDKVPRKPGFEMTYVVSAAYIEKDEEEDDDDTED